jgi:hypothetical protein
MRLVGLLAAIAALTLAAPAAADANEWAVTPIQPTGSIQATPYGSSETEVFQFQGTPLERPAEAINITIWNQNPGAALFPESSRVDFFPVSESPVDPSVYMGHTINTWAYTPGTYYWRAAARIATLFSSTTLESAVFSFVVSPRQEKTIPLAQCAELAARARNTLYRQRHLESAIDLAHSRKRRKHLRSEIRGLRAERVRLSQESDRLCVSEGR